MKRRSPVARYPKPRPVRSHAARPASSKPRPPYVVAITGASGAVYGHRLVLALARRGQPLFLVISRVGFLTLASEMDLAVPPPERRSTPEKAGLMGENPVARLFPELSVLERRRITFCHEDDLQAPPASGSSDLAGMIIAPCSMKTVAAIRAGLASTLITRAADVTIKERRPLLLIPRETPLSAIHLDNLLALSRLGAIILPPMPAFYDRPRTLDDLVDLTVSRALKLLGFPVPGLDGRRWFPEND